MNVILVIVWLIVNGAYLPVLDYNQDGIIDSTDLQLAINEQIGSEGAWPMQGMGIVITSKPEIFVMPAHFDVNDSGYEFHFFGWPSHLVITEGERQATIVYSPGPCIYVDLETEGILIGVIPSDWRWRDCLRREGVLEEHRERRLVTVTDDHGGTRIHFRYMN